MSASKLAAWRGVVPVLLALPVLWLLQYGMSDLPFATYLACVVGVNVLLAISLNVVNGMTGQFSLGHAGFMAVGAYLSAKLSIELHEIKLAHVSVAVSDQLFLLLSIGVGGTAAAVCGWFVGLPSLRLRGDYLAIVTLGFGEIIRVAVQNTKALGGALGLSGAPQTASVFMVWFWVFLAVLAAQRLAASCHGRSLWAIREDEVAAEAMGVDTTGYKVRAFVVSAFFGGVAGALFAHFVPIINPGSFTFSKSIEIVAMVVLGGLGSTSGAIVAAVCLTLLPEVMRSVLVTGAHEPLLAQRVDQIRMPLYGLLLVGLMLARPQGLFGWKEAWELDWVRRVLGRRSGSPS